MKFNNKKYNFIFFTLILSLFILLVTIELFHRMYFYFVSVDTAEQYLLSAYSERYADYSNFDFDLGFRYKPNLSVDKNNPFPISFRTNSSGQIADREYSIQKPSNVYRIAIIGDSFTVGIMTTNRITNLIEQHFEKTKGPLNDRIEVLNFAMDGIGIMQFKHIFKYMARSYAPDLVIASIITGDIDRKFYVRGTINKKTVNESDLSAKITKIVDGYDMFTIDIDWLRLIGVIPGNSYYSLDSLFEQFLHPKRLYKDIDAAFEISASALKYLNENSNLLVIQIPHIEELRGDKIAGLAFENGMDRLSKLTPDIKIHSIENCMKLRANGQPDKLYNMPHDAHPNALGNKVIAACMLPIITEHIRVSTK